MKLFTVVVRFVAVLSLLALLAVVLQKYADALPATPLTIGICVVVLVLALYRESVFWRKFSERQNASAATVLGGQPDRLHIVLEEVQRLLPRDPVAAQRALEVGTRLLRDRGEAEREGLRRRARQDQSAAHELERNLRHDLTAYRDALEAIRRVPSEGSARAALVSELELQIATAQRDLTKLSAFLRQGSNADGAA